MATRSEMEDFARGIYADRVRGDVDALVRRFAPGAAMHIAGAPEISVALRAEGEADLRAALEGLCAAFEFSDPKLLDSVIEGSKGAFRWQVTVHNIANRKNAVTELMDVFTLKDGRMTGFLEYCDTALAAQMLAP